VNFLSVYYFNAFFLATAQTHQMRKARSDAARSFYFAVGRKIAEIRQRQRLTQDALGREISLTRTSVVNIEKGKQQLLLHTLVLIARALKVEPSELLPDSDFQYQLASDSLVRLVEDPGARAWIETSLKRSRLS
jgi:transcriptional regulator with XRE-family HTH domain